jgi:hypothetical protein
MLSMRALFWVLLICVAAFEVVHFRSRRMRVWLRGNTPLNWLFASAFVTMCGTISLLLAKGVLAARTEKKNIARKRFRPPGDGRFFDGHH